MLNDVRTVLTRSNTLGSDALGALALVVILVVGLCLPSVI